MITTVAHTTITLTSNEEDLLSKLRRITRENDTLIIKRSLQNYYFECDRLKGPILFQPGIRKPTTRYKTMALSAEDKRYLKVLSRRIMGTWTEVVRESLHKYYALLTSEESVA